MILRSCNIKKGQHHIPWYRAASIVNTIKQVPVHNLVVRVPQKEIRESTVLHAEQDYRRTQMSQFFNDPEFVLSP